MEAPTSSSAMRALRLERSIAALLRSGQLSRTELSQLTGYSAASMTVTIRDLMGLGFVREAGWEKSTGGRRRTMLQFDRTKVLLTLAAVEATQLLVSQIDLHGETQAQIRRRLDTDHPIDSLRQALSALHAVVEQPSKALVLSLPGVVSSDGDVTLAPALGAPVTERLVGALEEATGIPVVVENDVNLLALGESATGAARGIRDFALIYIGDGIGAALVLDGVPYRGASQSAGEIGFLPWQQSWPVRGNSVGPLEGEWALPAIHHKSSALDLPATHILNALEQSPDPQAGQILADALEAWAFAAVTTACVVNPALIMFAGQVAELSQTSKEKLVRLVSEATPANTSIAFAQLGNAAIAHGAIALIEATPRLILESPLLAQRAHPKSRDGAASLPPSPATKVTSQS